MGNRNSQDDCQAYLDGYPNKEDPPLSKQRDNLDFYFNVAPSQPEGDLIDNIHTKWFGDYQKLERHHGYIQWIFPIRENGMNPESLPLTLEEASGIKENEEAKLRVIKSYKLMLNFYGIKLDNEEVEYKSPHIIIIIYVYI
jgi:hypothetical protein